MFNLKWCKKSEEDLSEMQELMKERKDYGSMRLPRSFANIQQQLFPEEDKKANKALHTDGNSAALHCRW